MSATNTTTNLGLSQFVNTDVPAWRQDYNGDMLKIDNAYTADISGATAETSADPSDYMKFYDVSATTNKKILISDLLKGAKVEDLTDTDITTPIEDDGLVYDATAQKWKNVPIMTKEQWQETGAYNLLKPGHASISDYGALFVENADGTVTKSGTVSGGNAQYVFVVPTNEPYTPVADLIPGRKYKLVGCPSGGGDNVYEIYLQYRNADNTGWAETYHDYGNGVEFTAKNARFGVYIRVFNGNADTLKFKPMITTDLNATYDDYVPYAKTNRELTEYATTKVGSLSASQYTTSAENVRVRQVGNSVHIWGFCNNNIQHSDGSNNNVLGTITGVTLPKTDEAVRTVCGIAAHAYDVPQQVGYLSLATNGELIFKTTQTGTKSVYFDISYAV